MENPYGSTPDHWRLCSDYLVVDDFAKEASLIPKQNGTVILPRSDGNVLVLQGVAI